MARTQSPSKHRTSRGRPTRHGTRVRPAPVRARRRAAVDVGGDLPHDARPTLPPIEKRMVRVRPVVKRRWWRLDGPKDPGLPEGYAYEYDGWDHPAGSPERRDG